MQAQALAQAQLRALEIKTAALTEQLETLEDSEQLHWRRTARLRDAHDPKEG